MPYKSEIRIAGGVPTLYIDGRPFPAAAYMSYLDERADYNRFAEAGYKIFTFPVYFAGRTINVLTDISPFRRGIYDSEENPDYTEVDRELSRIVRAYPDACIIPRVNIAMPLWWEEQNPSELNRLDNGGERSSFPFCRESFSSLIWRKTADRLLRQFIDHIGETPYASNIAGYHIASGGTEEWFHFGSPLGGLGECAERGYLRFISEKYPGDADMIKELPSFKIYNNGGKRISDVNIIRFLEYTGETVADSICHFAAVVKSKTDRRLIVGSFYGYTLEITDARFGTHALNRLLKCPDIDFLSSPASYMNGRAPGIDHACMSVLDSIKLHGKLFFTENDIRTYLTRPLRECRPDACRTGTYQGGVWEGPASPEVSLWVIRNCFARNLTHGTGQWWFDMWGGWYADDPIMADMKAFLRISEAALQDSNRSSVAEVAVIASEESYRYTNPLEGSVFRQNYMSRLPLGLAGAPYDIYDLNDMDKLPERIKIVVFLNLTGCEETAAAFCRSHPEKTILFTGSEGSDTQNTRYSAGQLTTGILRGTYKEAGVHIYIETDDVVHVCENYIAVHAATAGLKTLCLKKRSNILPLLPETPAFTDIIIRFDSMLYETRIFRIDPAG